MNATCSNMLTLGQVVKLTIFLQPT